MAEMPSLVGEIHVNWHHADPKDVPVEAVMVDDQCGPVMAEQPNAEKIGWKSPGETAHTYAHTYPHDGDSLRDSSQADRWRLRIGNRATVIIEEHANFPRGASPLFSVKIEVERSDATLAVTKLGYFGHSYDDAYTIGVELARQLVEVQSMTDSARQLGEWAVSRAEAALRQGDFLTHPGTKVPRG